MCTIASILDGLMRALEGRTRENDDKRVVRRYWEDEMAAVADQLIAIDEEAAAEQGDNADYSG